MRFTEEQKSKISANLKISLCPNCHYDGKQLFEDGEYQLTSFNTSPTSDSMVRVHLPIAAIVCPICAHVTLFSLLDLKNKS
ncbi:hypothetical protein HMPREF1212_01551 [Parabacteroides sp. HGS0025]|uniref:hypothetical protein n=1 Tax=Parabacteroides sp. HGS0025 TaxID=1078087 RepID=UPI00061779CC|nr:hypothetical protein [Parabacteroides sp. HGS0025]KKB50824.1 hypothetical protein HMPREF1212_01551 [Parabacteroides sp. HGS0025]